MKNLLTTLCLLCVIFCNILQAQKTDSLVSNKAFDKLIIQDITYSIFGESSPVNGIKIDISKPDASITGIFPLNEDKSFLLGLEFKGGITDKNFSILKGYNSFNTAFEFKPTLYIISNHNSAKYPPESTHKFELAVAKANIRKAKMKIELESVDDYIASKLLYDYYFQCIKTKTCTYTLPELTKTQKLALIRIIKNDLKITDERLNVDNDTKIILQSVKIADSMKNGDIDLDTYNDKVDSITKIYRKKYDKCEDEGINKEIEIASSVWTQKNYIWFSISPYLRTEKVNLYHTKFKELDSLYFKKDYPFNYGINFSGNFLIVVPNRISHYLKAGINLSRSNNISTLESFNYTTTTPFFSNGNSNTEKNKTGVAYNLNDLKNGFLGQLVGEYYLVPMKNLVPGLYITANLNYSNFYKLTNIKGRENDKIQFGTEGGLVFNINDTTKDRSLLSILLYGRFEDLTDSKRLNKNTNIYEEKDDFIDRNLSFGIKIGIPISLPKKSQL
ncbi:hypothetical protein [Chryseobacterium sp. FH1]|uniref:hypothetical protein n=1 Tax=Chryseobacterium sp. FH1 TaxID=1233951 RepID=UPI0004E34CCD|nr:hypothetical protein [Chryseobacterium sp. FH1]KFC20069.1 hypothetical protein IO90_12760 [Chryseobacterium sp. FH1]